MTAPTKCPRCLTALPKDTPAGLCPLCLAAGALTRGKVSPGAATEVPTLPDAGGRPWQMLAGRFKLEHLLGRGGMGEVWQARDEQLEQDVALKLLPSKLRDEPAAMKGLKGETVRGKRLAHPHIVRIHDLHDASDQLFVSMELVVGQNLEQMREHSPEGVMTWERLAPWVQQLCEALTYAHGEGVIHRDLKPSNLMVDARGRLKLADFGIAATVSASLNHISLLHPRSGTLQYMSPQQMAGLKPRATDDLYAVGSVLYHLLTGMPPFHQGDIAYQLAHVPARPIAERQTENEVHNPIPPVVAAAIMACLEKEPRKRPQTAAELAQRLGLAAATVAATPAGATVAAKTFRARLGAAGVALLDWAQHSTEALFHWRHLRRWWAAGLGGAGGSALAGLLLLHPVVGGGLHRLSFDVSAVRHPPPLPAEAVMVYLDDRSHEELKQPYNGPWNRAVHAQLLDRLKRDGARLVVFDILFDEPNPNQIAGDDALAAAIKKHGNVILSGESDEHREPGQSRSDRSKPPFERLATNAVAWGLSTFLLDPDGAARRPGEGTADVPSLALVAARAAGLLNAPTGQRWLRYYGPPQTIPGKSICDALQADGVPPGFFREKLVFVGSRIRTGFSGAAKDTFATPYTRWGGGVAPGAEIHATACLNLLHGHGVRRWPHFAEAALVLALGAVLGWTLVMLRVVAAALLAAVAGVLIFWGADAAFRSGQLWLPWGVALVQVAVAFIAGLSLNALRQRLEAGVMTRSLALHLPARRVKEILRNPETLRPGAEKREVTILWSHINGFATIADRTLEEKIYERLNGYFTGLLACVHGEQGTVVRLLGEGVFAIWNAPEEQPRHQELACRAALAMRDRIATSAGTQPGFRLETRIGLHFGTASVGNYGSDERFDYTAIGSSVSRAALLERLNEPLGTQILASETVALEADAAVESRALGSFSLPGVEHPVVVHEILGLRSGTAPNRLAAEFADALGHFHARDWDAAEAGFNRVLGLKPKDGPARFYLARTQLFRTSPPPPKWYGEVKVEELATAV